MAARDSAEHRTILADFYEEAGSREWASWLRASRWDQRLLARTLRKRGLRMEVSESPFRAKVDVNGPFLDTLCWTVKKPAVVHTLLATPAYALADKLHLGSFRPRSAVPSVLETLRERPLHTLDVFDVPIDPELFGHWNLETLAVRSTGPVARTDVRHLCIRVVRTEEFMAWKDTDAPFLERLEIRPTQRDVEVPLPVLENLLGAPHLRSVVLAYGMPSSVERHIRELSPVAVSTYPPRGWRTRPPDPWVVIG